MIGYCEICGKKSIKNKVICSDKCGEIRQKLIDLGRKYFPTNGCDNCWGDLHQGCTEQCQKEFRESLEFGKDLWSLIRIIYPNKESEEE